MLPATPPSRAPREDIKSCLACGVYCKPSAETVLNCSSCEGVFCSKECINAGLDAHKTLCRPRPAIAKETESRRCPTCGKGIGMRGPDGQPTICQVCGTVFCTKDCFKQSPCGVRAANYVAAVAELIVNAPTPTDRRGVQTVVGKACKLMEHMYTANQTCKPRMLPSATRNPTLRSAPPSGAAAPPAAATQRQPRQTTQPVSGGPPAAATQRQPRQTTQPAATNAPPMTDSVAVAAAPRKRKATHMMGNWPPTPVEQAEAAAAIKASMSGLREQLAD